MTYEIYTDEIVKVHNSYYVDAESEEEAIKKFENGQYNDCPLGDVYDSEIIGYEIFLTDEN